MHVLILGAAGMVGRKLTERLARDGGLGDRAIDHVTLFDVVAPDPATAGRLPATVVAGDLAEPGRADALVAGRPDVIFHFAAIVSGEAEADFEKVAEAAELAAS